MHTVTSQNYYLL